MKATTLTPLDEYRKKLGSDAAVARKLGFDVVQVRRWLKQEHYAGLNARKLAAMQGVSLPEKPL